MCYSFCSFYLQRWAHGARPPWLPLCPARCRYSVVRTARSQPCMCKFNKRRKKKVKKKGCGRGSVKVPAAPLRYRFVSAPLTRSSPVFRGNPDLAATCTNTLYGLVSFTSSVMSQTAKAFVGSVVHRYVGFRFENHSLFALQWTQ